jgi:hypothetical protein
MANILYNAGLKELLSAATAWDAGTFMVDLERSTSSYSPDKDDDSILDAAGLVLIDVASYAAQRIASPTVTVVDASDLVKLDCGDVDFGSLEAGQTVKAAIVYRDDGGNGVPLLYLDNDSGGLLPRALGGGNFQITINASGLIIAAQV